MKPLRHFTHPYLLNPVHPVTVSVCGAGGTGSQIITGLGRVDYALRALGHPGFHVTVYDGDQVSPANIGRQLFSEAETGENKAAVMVSRVNRFFGRRWQAVPHHLAPGRFDYKADATNILITCVDNIAARQTCHGLWASSSQERKDHPHNQQLYWLDFGNTKNTAQLVIGTVGKVKQPKGPEYRTVSRLPDLFTLYPHLLTEEEPANEPSCSLMVSLGRQDLMINSVIASLGTDLLYRLFREGGLSHQGVFINLPELLTAKIPLAGTPVGKTRKKGCFQDLNS